MRLEVVHLWFTRKSLAIWIFRSVRAAGVDTSKKQKSELLAEAEKKRYERRQQERFEATALHKRWSGKGIIIAGVDDHKLENNPGRAKALEAAAAVNGVAIFPKLSAEQREQGMTDFNFNDLGRVQPEVMSRQLVATVNATKEGRTIREAEKLRADSTRPKESLEIEKVRPIGFILVARLSMSHLVPLLEFNHEWIRSEVIESGHGSLDEGHWPTTTERQRTAAIEHLGSRRLLIRFQWFFQTLSSISVLARFRCTAWWLLPGFLSGRPLWPHADHSMEGYYWSKFWFLSESCDYDSGRVGYLRRNARLTGKTT